MRSTFMGLEASKKGLFVQQSALYTTGHNISNANTEGYSRQRVNMAATPGYPHPGLNSPTYPGHLGTGVEATSVQRIRDQFIDRQYRQESNKLGYWETTLNSINQMEDILSEPSEFGINQSFNDFWKSLQDVAANPENTAARNVTIAKAEALADAFNYNYTQLEVIQGNIGNEIDVITKDVNSLLKKIADVNAQIIVMEPNGYVMNDLYDARDLLIDELNEYLPVSIENVPSGGKASEVAEGSITVKFDYVDDQGKSQSIALVNGQHYAQVSLNSDAGKISSTLPANPFTNFTVEDSGKTSSNNQIGLITTDADGKKAYGAVPALSYDVFEPSKGKLVSLIDSYGYVETDANGNVVTDPVTNQPIKNGLYPEMLAQLDKLAMAFKDAFNVMHQAGHTLEADAPDANGKPQTKAGEDFFGGTGAKDLRVLIKDPKKVAASSGTAEEGNGKWATELANLQFLGVSGQTTTILGKTINFGGAGGGVVGAAGTPTHLDGATFQGFYTGFIGDMAVKGQEAKRLEYNSGTLKLTLENNRASMSSVSLDEEMTNMITFQQAYNANARMITVVDETLDKIINGMGRVGL